jgi:hypothetical protein
VTQTYDPLAGTTTSSSSTITGSAIEVRGDVERYKALGLVLSTMPTLFFSPTTYGECPQAGDSVVWPETNGSTYTVRDVARIAPDGVTIAARVVIGK